ncbi:PREDICTED: calcium-binding tyrosine phosphorylation-regulated protein [Pygoscelis adeliae]|uniref:calcium-binding tyrosine phosphorylation-regulated protein n=1 Tax=Pygoscelis adeliae TaxID=9238 RepID=UPI0004F4E56B|nr:PREDICTED: calcium-binding tyrosine phosphorylation-regulated protein [Pygoscelis adeliae]
MQSSKIRLVVPHGLKTLLEGVSRAVVENNPNDVAEFFALYFQELVTFQKGNPNLDITELVEKFEFISENGNEGLQEKTVEYTDTLFSGEPKQRDKCTDTEEDQLLEEPDIQYSSKITQHPSIASSIAESKLPPGSDGASSPEEPELVYVPAEPAQLAAHVLAMASSEAGQPSPHSNVWTLYCLTDLRQGQKSPPSRSPAGAGVPYSQAPLSLSRGEDQQCGQLSQVPAPIYVIQEESKRRDAPPFILVGSNVQNVQDWKPIPGHAVFAQQDAGARRRLTTVPVPVARPADEKPAMASLNSNSAEETAAEPCRPDVFSVAIPLDDVMSAKKGSPAGHKHAGIDALAESYGTAG